MIPKTTPYAHTPKPEIEQYMNQGEWQENTLQEVEEQVLSRTTSEIPIPREKIDKRLREDDYPSVTKFSAKEFKIYRKKIKTDSKIDFPPLEET